MLARDNGKVHTQKSLILNDIDECGPKPGRRQGKKQHTGCSTICPRCSFSEIWPWIALISTSKSASLISPATTPVSKNVAANWLV